MSKDFSVTIEDLVLCDITSLKQLYENELIWDTVMNFRVITLMFEGEFSSESCRKRPSYYELKTKWYKKLINELPEMLYFLNEVQFREALYVLLYGFSLHASNHVVAAVQAGERPMAEALELNVQLKAFLLQSIEDMYTIDQAPKELMMEVYLDILNMNKEQK